MVFPIAKIFSSVLRWLSRRSTADADQIADLQAIEARYRALWEAGPDLVLRMAADGTYLDIVRGTEVKIYKAAQLQAGASIYDIMPGEQAHERMGYVRQALRTHQTQFYSYEILVDGDRRFEEARIIPIKPDEVLVVVRDVTKAERIQAQMTHNALHDPLTNLLNRWGLMQRLDKALAQAHRTQRYGYAVLFININRFSRINHSLGYAVGDQLLMVIAERLSHQIDDEDAIARLGADEFVIVFDAVTPAELAAIVQAILQDGQGLTLDDHKIVVDLRIGLVTGDPQYRCAAEVIRNAGIAVQWAKRSPGPAYACFNGDMQAQIARQLSVEVGLRRALLLEEFTVCYQPIVDLNSTVLMGLEALVRWRHPSRSPMPPEEFIGIAEETGLIDRLDRWVFFQACHQIAAWSRRFPAAKDLTVSVNLAAQDLERPRLLADIDATLAATGLPGKAVGIEITETLLAENTNQTLELIQQLGRRGIRVGIDDFGTGYSSLGYLSWLPAHYLKIDKTFVAQMRTDHHQQIVRTVVDLSHRLSLMAIAEGIETPAQLQCLQELGCDYGQGYLFAKPLPPQEIEAQFFYQPGRPRLRLPAETFLMG
ncbi:MAG: EAL domain-containing protein [Cyanobacteria bacterium P01_A01_bin.135]